MISSRKDEVVLVTGATGCIGGRLVERLILERGTPVRALVRDWSRAIRLARFSADLRRGAIGNAADVDAAVEGCSVVVHCAHDYESPEANIDAARALIAACAKHRVRRLVYVSTLSVYEPLPPGTLDESAPRVPCGWTYPDNKLRLEQLFEEAHAREQLPVVMVEPTIVYGPYSQPWTLRPINMLRKSRLVLPDDGEGICNVVYVDDVVDSLVLAMEAEPAVGERLLISGDETVTWRRFFGAYEEMLGVSSLAFLPSSEVEAYVQGAASSPNRPRSSIWRDPKTLLREALGDRLVERIGPRIKQAASKRLPASFVWPSEQELALHRGQTRVSIDNARKLLGYEPRVSFERGMSLTAEFVAWARL